MAEGGLSMWTLYENPTDYPNKCVARRIDVRATPYMTDDVLIADDLAKLREMLPGGLFRMERHPTDDPCIVETWM